MADQVAMSVSSEMETAGDDSMPKGSGPSVGGVDQVDQVDAGGLATALAQSVAQDAAPDGEKETRRKRRSRARARTISIRRLSKAELNRGKELYPEMDYWRPKTRGECADMERPCPFVSCKYHLYIDVHPVRGSIKVNFPDLEVWEMTDTCALDIAGRGGITLEDVGAIMNLTRERVRQLETAGLSKLKTVEEVETLRDYIC